MFVVLNVLIVYPYIPGDMETLKLIYSRNKMVLHIIVIFTSSIQLSYTVMDLQGAG